MLNEVLRLTQGDLTNVLSQEGKCRHGQKFGTECTLCIKEQHAAFRGKKLQLDINNENCYKGESNE